MSMLALADRAAFLQVNSNKDLIINYLDWIVSHGKQSTIYNLNIYNISACLYEHSVDGREILFREVKLLISFPGLTLGAYRNLLEPIPNMP